MIQGETLRSTPMESKLCLEIILQMIQGKTSRSTPIESKLYSNNSEMIQGKILRSAPIESNDIICR